MQRPGQKEQNVKSKDTKTPDKTDLDCSFTNLGYFITPEIKISINRRPAINSRAQEVTKDLFSKESITKKCKNDKLKGQSGKKGKAVSEKKTPECWFCFLCREDRQVDMRLCSVCYRYVHEECVGLTKEDKTILICPDCGSSP